MDCPTVIGCCFPEKLLKRYLSNTFLAKAHASGFTVTALQPDQPIPSGSGAPDIILHKVMDNAQWAAELARFTALHPNAVIIDPLHCVLPLTSRRTMHDRVRPGFQIPHPTIAGLISVRAPLETFIPAPSSLADALPLLRSAAIPFPSRPLLLKPVASHGSDAAHCLVVVATEAALGKALAAPCDSDLALEGGAGNGWVAQEYVPHSTGVVKVYVIGEATQAILKASIPPPSPADPLDSPRLFSAVSKADPSAEALPHAASSRVPEEAELQAICAAVGRELAQRLQLTIFNVDILIREGVGDEEEEGMELVIVDINYLPGIDKLAGWEEMLVKALQWRDGARRAAGPR